MVKRIFTVSGGSDLTNGKVKIEALAFLPNVCLLPVALMGHKCIAEGILSDALRALIPIGIVLHILCYADSERICADKSVFLAHERVDLAQWREIYAVRRVICAQVRVIY